MGSRTWIKIYCERWLGGTIREESAELRAIFVDLLALAGSGRYGDTGEIKLAGDVGFDDRQIAKILKIEPGAWDRAKVRLIETQRISVNGDNIIHILKWEKYQSEYERQKPYRESNEKLQAEVTSKSDGEKEKEKEKEKENRRREDIPPTPYQGIINLWIELLPSLPKPSSPIVTSCARGKAIKARWKENPDLEIFRSIFTKVQASDFLSGRNGKWTSCNIDWVLKPSNWQKIKEGNYDKKGASHDRIPASGYTKPEDLP